MMKKYFYHIQILTYKNKLLLYFLNKVLILMNLFKQKYNLKKKSNVEIVWCSRFFSLNLKILSGLKQQRIETKCC